MHDVEAKLQIQVALSCKYITEAKIFGEKSSIMDPNKSQTAYEL
jgi:hypothetical protein